MGQIVHHAILITGKELKSINDIRNECLNIFKKHVNLKNTSQIISGVVSSFINDFHSFTIVPDGSKDGYDTSLECDNAREAVIKFISSIPSSVKEKISLHVTEIKFGGSDNKTEVTYYE